jgi:hypothetical protein
MITFCFLAASLTAGADDIAQKLEEAKAVYKVDLEKSHSAVREWFDKRENTVRKDGNKKLLDQIKAEQAKYNEVGELPKVAPPDLARNFADVFTVMEAAYLTAIKDYTRAKQDDQAALVEKQLETFKRSWNRPNPLDLEITTDMLKAKFAADKPTFDQKTGVLRLTYQFSNRKELKDFEFGDVEPKVVGNSVVLNAGQTLKHVAQFDFVTVTGVVGVNAMRGMVLTTTGGTSAGLGGSNHDTIYLAPKGQRILEKIVPVASRQGAIHFGVTVAEKRATLYWGNDQLGGESAGPGAGQVVLQGGDSGFAYGSLVISGRLNREWAKKYFTPSDK